MAGLRHAHAAGGAAAAVRHRAADALGALLWGLLGAASVPLAYLLACRVLRERWQARTAGIAALLWFPNLSTTGFFLSETPFCARSCCRCTGWWCASRRAGAPGRRAWPRRSRSCCGRRRRCSTCSCC
ncbi:hypothetical protein [Nannocystis pusilla]|uniref:hypothetical protein n=1 Tax=Nannocystis pusilla TaxID=889268 RepID=UPI003B80E416